MYDTHFDLLSILYVLYDNKVYIDRLVDNINKNYVGLNANLYFMNKDEMKKELGITENIDVTEMFKKSTDIFNKLDIKSKVIFSIEGCDYIKDCSELEVLYSLGLRSMMLTWNNENRYGSGNRTDKGLTDEGKSFIEKAIDLGIAIDLSHANENTFYDIIDVIKNYDKKAICFVSHSNIYELCNNSRNLKREQLEVLKEVGGYIGLVMHPPFITDSMDFDSIKDNYLKHIKYAVDVMGDDRVMLATDNLEFYNELETDASYVPSPFKQKSIKEDIKKLLSDMFDEEVTSKIIYKNAMRLYDKINN